MREHLENNEQDILKRLKLGDQHALSALYDLYSKKLIYYVQRTAKSPFLAEDIVHDTFIKIWQHREHIDPSKPFKPYLFTIAKRTLLNLLKRARQEAEILSEIKKYTFEDDHTMEMLLAYNESNLLINKAIDSLTGQVKKTFILCRIQGMSYKQAAEALSITESTVNKHMSKALQIIRKRIMINNSTIIVLFFIFYWMVCLSRVY